MPRPRALTVVAALGVVYVIWGSTYLAIRIVIETLPPFLMASARWIVGGVVLYVFAIRRGDGSDRPTLTHWRSAAVIGTALCLGGNGLVAVAEQRVASGTAALLVATVPLWLVLFEWLRHRVKPSKPVSAGLVVGFIGTGILVLPGGAGAVDPSGAGLVLLAGAIWAAGSLYARRARLPSRPLVAAGMEMIMGGIALLVAATIVGEWARLDLRGVSRSSGIALAYLAVFGSIVAFTSYVWLLRNVQTSLVATYAYVNPLVAVVLGSLIADERLTATMIAGGLVIVAAVALIVTASGGTPRAADEPPIEERPDLASQELPA